MACFAAAITARTPQCLLLFSDIPTINVQWQHTVRGAMEGKPPNVTQYCWSTAFVVRASVSLTEGFCYAAYWVADRPRQWHRLSRSPVHRLSFIHTIQNIAVLMLPGYHNHPGGPHWDSITLSKTGRHHNLCESRGAHLEAHLQPGMLSTVVHGTLHTSARCRDGPHKPGQKQRCWLTGHCSLKDHWS